MISLILETSTERGIIGLFKDDVLLYENALPFGLQNSKTLLPEIALGFKSANLTPADLNYIATGIGPGSYTGIRVGAMTAKTLSFALDIPLIGICSLHGFVPDHDGHFAAVIDARIGGVYMQQAEKKEGIVRWIGEPILSPLAEAVEILKQTKTLVTPMSLLLKPKFEALSTDILRNWIEKGPDIHQIQRQGQVKYQKNLFSDQQQLDLLYLRKTQAEIETNR